MEEVESIRRPLERRLGCRGATVMRGRERIPHKNLNNQDTRLTTEILARRHLAH